MIYEVSHEPEAFGISKILTKQSTLFAIYLLDFVLPQVSKLSKSLQTEKLDLSVISGIVDATLHTLEDAVLPAANWILQLQDIKDEIETTIGIKNFQSRVAKPFLILLKENIQNRFNSQDLVSSFSIFDPKRCQIHQRINMVTIKLKLLFSTMVKSFKVKQLLGMNM